jgi:hypothetical protein
MKKVYALLFLTVLVLAVAAYWSFSSNDLEKETVAIAIEAVEAISESWDAEELKARADPGLIKAMSSQGQSVEQLFQIYSVLGKLKQEVDCKVHTTGSFMKGGERHTTISYECGAEYENGEAVVFITLKRAESATEWQIYYINIRSDTFSNVIE